LNGVEPDFQSGTETDGGVGTNNSVGGTEAAKTETAPSTASENTEKSNVPANGTEVPPKPGVYKGVNNDEVREWARKHPNHSIAYLAKHFHQSEEVIAAALGRSA
jgi:hypothetical protein